MDYMNSLVDSWNSNGKLCICADLHDLSKAIKCNYYGTMTVEVTHELVSNTMFTKLDGTNCYICIILDELSFLTAFNSLFGHSCFVCLQFGLICLQDIFQWMMDLILDRYEGMIDIADEVVIHSKDDNVHDCGLCKFM